MKIVFYTGEGSNKNGLHTEEEFIKIMNKKFAHRVDDAKALKLRDWVQWSGAELMSARKVVVGNSV